MRWGSLPAWLTGYGTLLSSTLLWIPAAEAWQGWLLLAVAGGAAALLSGVGGEIVAAYTGDIAGSASPLYHAVIGVAAVAGNVLAGLLWVLAGPGAVFGYASWALGLGVALLVAWLPWLRRGFPSGTGFPDG
jgi:hypothetical protein